MKKIIIIISLLILLTGCDGTELDLERSEESRKIYIDKETCVEYFNNRTYYGNYVLTPRYDNDRKVKINKKCVREKEGE